MKKLLLAVTSLFIAIVSVPAQNIQFHYDFGSALYHSGYKSERYTRPNITTTVEMFKPDKWGNTFFFVDMNYGNISAAHDGGVLGAYWEISRELKLGDSPLLAHVEYNGGMDHYSGSYDDAWLGGLTYAMASQDFSKTLSFTAMYKAIPRNAKCVHNFQFTTVWNVMFCHNRFKFDGFLDFWKENRPWQHPKNDLSGDGTDYILLTEPQIWYNMNTIKGMEDVNLSVGSEIEISNNFCGYGMYVNPTLAVKWTF
jgi:hypothetical protein